MRYARYCFAVFFAVLFFTEVFLTGDFFAAFFVLFLGASRAGRVR